MSQSVHTPTLSEDEIIILESWEDVFNLPGHRVDVEAGELEKVLAQYSFPEKAGERPCGLRCRRLHRNGFVVQLKDGSLTHIGKDCGAREFPQWKAMVGQYRAVARDRRLRLELASLPDEAQREVQTLSRYQEIMGPYDQLHSDLWNKLPGRVRSKLYAMAHSGDGTIRQRRSDEAIKRDKALQSQGLISEVDYHENVGRLRSIGGWKYNTPKWAPLRKRLDAFANFDAETADVSALKAVDKQWRELRSELEAIHAGCNRNISFLSADNLAQIRTLVRTMSLTAEEQAKASLAISDAVSVALELERA